MIKVAFKKFPEKKQNGVYTKRGFIPFKGDYFYSPTDFKGVEGEVRVTPSILIQLLDNPCSEESLTNWVLESLKRYIPLTSIRAHFSEPKVGENEISIHFKVGDLEVNHPKAVF